MFKNDKEKLEFIKYELKKLKGLEFIDNSEIEACDLAIEILSSWNRK